MELSVNKDLKIYQIDLTSAVCLAIPYDYGGSQPNFYDAPPGKAAPFQQCEFFGEVKNNNGCNVMGADINPAAISVALRKGIPAELITPKFYEKYKLSFDIIINSHVLEHVDDPKDFLVNIRGLLKEDGAFVIAIPQERIRGDITLLQILYFLSRLKFENPHKHKFSKDQLFTLLKEAGFVPQDYIFCNLLPPFLTKHLIYLKSRSLVVKCTKN